MYCPNCGKMISDQAAFCRYCGTKTMPFSPEADRMSGSGGYPDSYGYPGPGNPQGNPIPAGRYGNRQPVRNPQYAMARPKSNIRWLVLAVIVFAAVLSVVYFFFLKAGKPEDTIAKLEKGLNKLDQKEVLECFDSQTQDLYSGGLGVAGDLLDTDLGAWSDLASGLGGFLSGSGLTPKISLQIEDIQYYDKTNCLVTVEFVTSYQGESQAETVELPMYRDGRKWVISASSLQYFY